MPGITLDVNSLVTMANRAMQTDPQRSIIVKDGGFREVGKLGAFFARKSECRMVGQALLQSLRQTYGDEVADATAQDLRGVMDKGKPLTARMIKDALDNAETLSEAIRRHNTLTRMTFFAGSGGQKDFEAALRHYCSIFNHDPNDPDLRLYARDAVLNALKDSQKSLTADDFYDAVISLHLVLTNNTLTAARSARETADLVDTLAVWNGMTGAQRKEILLSVNKAIMQAVQNPREFVSQQSLRTLANNVACLKIFELSGKIDEVAGELAAKYSYRGRDLREAFRAHVSWDLSRLLENAPAQTKEELSLDSLKKSFTDAKTHHLQEFLRKLSAPVLEARRRQDLQALGVYGSEEGVFGVGDYSFAQLHGLRVEDTATAKDWYAPAPEPAEQPAAGMSGDDCRDRNLVTAHAVQWKIRTNVGVLANVCQLNGT
ncbi:MAG: hypothetical protein IK129_06930 [Deltaproteobacteria bacterium]|nr:hypothetical protein [Deltaproteobacteria bacterium]